MKTWGANTDDSNSASHTKRHCERRRISTSPKTQKRWQRLVHGEKVNEIVACIINSNCWPSARIPLPCYPKYTYIYVHFMRCVGPFSKTPNKNVRRRCVDCWIEHIFLLDSRHTHASGRQRASQPTHTHTECHPLTRINTANINM